MLSLGLWPGALEAAATTGGKFRFIIVNDLHALSDECAGWLEGVVKRMKEDKPEFTIINGDLTELAERKYFGMVRDAFKELGTPIYVQLGNHDIKPNSRDRTEYEAMFPDRVNYHFEHKGWQFVALDSTQGTDYQNTRIQPGTFAWADENLKKLDSAKPTVLFTHFPMGAGVRMRPLNADELLERFKPFNLRGIFGGHYHAFTEKQWKEIAVVTNRCCALKRNNHDGTKEKGYFVCDADGVEIKREFRECPMPAAKGA